MDRAVCPFFQQTLKRVPRIFQPAELQLLGHYVLPDENEAASGAKKHVRQWSIYRLPSPQGVPQGYHRVTVDAGAGHKAEGQLIIATARAYLPEKLAAGGWAEIR